MAVTLLKAAVFTSAFAFALVVGFGYGWIAGYADSERKWRRAYDQA